jgi:hypothetical protein
VSDKTASGWGEFGVPVPFPVAFAFAGEGICSTEHQIYTVFSLFLSDILVHRPRLVMIIENAKKASRDCRWISHCNDDRDLIGAHHDDKASTRRRRMPNRETEPPRRTWNSAIAAATILSRPIVCSHERRLTWKRGSGNFARAMSKPPFSVAACQDADPMRCR